MVLSVTREELLKYAPDRPNYNYYLSTGEQEQVTPYSTQGIRGAAFLAGTAGVIGGFQALKRFGYNPWDPIYAGVRAIEEFSPGQVFRTFQAGNFLSQFTTTGRAPLSISAELVRQYQDTEWFRDLVWRAPGAEQATETGLRFTGTRLMAGETVLLENARKMTSVGNPYLAAAYSRVHGFPGLPNVDSPNKLKFNFPLLPGQDFSEGIYFTGASTRGKEFTNQVRALTSEWVERANRLADAPFGMEPFTTGLRGVQEWWERNLGTRFTLAVRSGTATETLGRMAWKWGGLGTAAFLGYQTADWAVRNTDLLNNTILGEGITAGVATLGVRANLMASRMADFLPGVRSYQEAQEELAPGSTSLMKLAAFPLTGALTGAGAHYILGTVGKARATRELMQQGLTFTQALPLAEDRWLKNSSSFVGDTISKFFQNRWGKSIPFLGQMSRLKALTMLGAATFTLPVLPFLPGALIPENTEEELSRIYSGEQEVAVRKGRFWESGRSPFEGSRIEYFRQHWFPRMINRLDKERSPISQWLRENLTYQEELEHYWDRPFPLSGSAFEDVPIVGPILAATIGRLVKPPQYMHTSEWLSSSGGGVIRAPGRLGELPPGEGELDPGTPVSGSGIQQVAGEQLYRLTELTGLVGFSLSTLKKAVTGEEEFFDQEERLQSARRGYGEERRYWDLSLGGGGFSTELLRRLYPHRRRQIPEYNPIANQAASWLPGPGERAPNFRVGDPFIAVPEGELRLPGPQYEAIHPELKGLSPEEYPDIYKYKILADVAPYAERTKILAAQLRARAKKGELSRNELQILDEVTRQTREKKVTREFTNFEILTGAPDLNIPGGSAVQSRESLAAINRILAEKKQSSITKTLIGGYWEAAARSLQNPLEALTPLAPGSKLLNMKTAIESYKQTQVYGPSIAMWGQPVEHFIKPFFRELSDLFITPDIPEEKRKVRGIEEYFDILQYVKNKRLAEAAQESGAGDVAGAYSRTAEETAIGINPYTRDYSALFRSLPRSERDFFGAFTEAATEEERTEILSLVPANLKRIYRAQWEQRYADTLTQALDKGLLTGTAAEAAEQDIQAFYDRKATEGFEATEELISRYREEAQSGEDYADWYRRSILIPAIAGEEGLPGPDWIGFHPQVDLEEIKLKVVKNEGLNIHDFNLWQSDELNAARKPALEGASEELVSSIIESESRSPIEIQKEVRKLLSELGIGSNAQIFIYEVSDNREEMKIEIHSSELRDAEVRQILDDRLEELS